MQPHAHPRPRAALVAGTVPMARLTHPGGPMGSQAHAHTQANTQLHASGDTRGRNRRCRSSAPRFRSSMLQTARNLLCLKPPGA